MSVDVKQRTEKGPMWAIVKRLCKTNTIETVIVTDDRADAIDRAVLLAADSDMLADRQDDREVEMVGRYFDGSGFYGTPDIDIFIARAFRP